MPKSSRADRRAKDRIAILGTVGVPGNYGGFETLAENLVAYHARAGQQSMLTVYCSAPAFTDHSECFGTARRRFLPLNANGVSSIAYDIWSLIDAVLHGHNRILLLGVSGALALPLIRLFPSVTIVTNIDGIEWRRGKWNRLARAVLRWSEWAAVRFSHRVIADNQAIADYVRERYDRPCTVIPYGGDHALAVDGDFTATATLPERYAIALCRIEPENNVAMILEAFAELDMPLVFFGNWDRSDYGRALKARYRDHPTITIHDPVYAPPALRAARDRATLYIHGHSAGGTNPALVEMMHFAIPVLAHGCAFNRHSTEGKARYFETSSELAAEVRALTPEAGAEIGAAMGEIARRRYTWDQIGKDYFDLLQLPSGENEALSSTSGHLNTGGRMAVRDPADQTWSKHRSPNKSA